MRLLVAAPAGLFAFTLLTFTAPAAKAGAASDARIQSLIDQLGDRSFAVRAKAQRRLCELGPAATDALKAAAKGERREVAIRAAEILKTLSHVLFTGVRVTLEGPVKPVGWDDAVRVSVKMENTSEHPANIPLFPESDDPARAVPAALEAARLIDFADYLAVSGPAGRHVSLHVDNIADLAPLEEAINQRLEVDARATLAPGQTRRVVFEAFNRGWARYRLLELGTYRVQLTYAPAWDDPDLRRRHVGSLESNVLEIEVQPPAPVIVRRDGRPFQAELANNNGKLVVELVCTSDVPIHLNTGLGPRLGSDATLTWVVRAKERRIEIKHPVSPAPKSSSKPPDVDRFRRLAAGERVIIATLPVADLLADRVVDTLQPGTAFTVQARYLNLLSRSFVRGGPDGGRKEIVPAGMTVEKYAASIPARAYTGEAATGMIELRKPE